MPSTHADLHQVLMCGPCPALDMQPLQAGDVLHKLLLAKDLGALLRACALRVRAVAKRGELGASATLIRQLPAAKIMACHGQGTDAINLAAARVPSIGGSASATGPSRSPATSLTSQLAWPARSCEGLRPATPACAAAPGRSRI